MAPSLKEKIAKFSITAILSAIILVFFCPMTIEPVSAAHGVDSFSACLQGQITVGNMSGSCFEAHAQAAKTILGALISNFEVGVILILTASIFLINFKQIATSANHLHLLTLKQKTRQYLKQIKQFSLQKYLRWLNIENHTQDALSV